MGISSPSKRPLKPAIETGQLQGCLCAGVVGRNEDRARRTESLEDRQRELDHRPERVVERDGDHLLACR